MPQVDMSLTYIGGGQITATSFPMKFVNGSSPLGLYVVWQSDCQQFTGDSDNLYYIFTLSCPPNNSVLTMYAYTTSAQCAAAGSPTAGSVVFNQYISFTEEPVSITWAQQTISVGSWGSNPLGQISINSTQSCPSCVVCGEMQLVRGQMLLSWDAFDGNPAGSTPLEYVVDSAVQGYVWESPCVKFASNSYYWIFGLYCGSFGPSLGIYQYTTSANCQGQTDWFHGSSFSEFDPTSVTESPVQVSYPSLDYTPFGGPVFPIMTVSSGLACPCGNTMPCNIPPETLLLTIIGSGVTAILQYNGATCTWSTGPCEFYDEFGNFSFVIKVVPLGGDFVTTYTFSHWTGSGGVDCMNTPTVVSTVYSTNGGISNNGMTISSYDCSQNSWAIYFSTFFKLSY